MGTHHRTTIPARYGITVLPASRHRWYALPQPKPDRPVLSSTALEGWKAELTLVLVTRNRIHNLSITSFDTLLPNHLTKDWIVFCWQWSLYAKHPRSTAMLVGLMPSAQSANNQHPWHSSRELNWVSCDYLYKLVWQCVFTWWFMLFIYWLELGNPNSHFKVLTTAESPSFL